MDSTESTQLESASMNTLDGDVPRVCYFFAIPVERVQNRTDSTILNIAFQGNLL